MSRFTKIAASGQPAEQGQVHVAVLDTTTGLMWSANDAVDADVDWSDADKACRELNLAGHSDWRLPTVEELFAIADRTRERPAIDVDAFPSCKSDWYWSSTPAAWSPESDAWFVYFSYGGAYADGRVSDARVRAVRSVAAAASQ